MLQALQMSVMVTLPFTLKAAINLGVPKILVDAGPGAELTAEEIATSIAKVSNCCADPKNLDRILRILASHNVVTENVSKDANESAQRSYGPTSTLKYFTDNEDGVSLAPLLLVTSEPVLLASYQNLHLPVMDVNVEPHGLDHGMNFFEYVATDAKLEKLFNKAMNDHSNIKMSALLKNYRGFENLTSLVDVGGGLGSTLAIILSKYPNLRGINFDQPQVVANGLQVPSTVVTPSLPHYILQTYSMHCYIQLYIHKNQLSFLYILDFQYVLQIWNTLVETSLPVCLKPMLYS